MSIHSSEPFSDRGHDRAVALRVEELYESHAPLVRAVCRSALRDRVEAEDAVQQTFLSAQRALANGSSPRDAAAWLATIARNESLARVRSRMREPLPLETEAVGAGPDAYTTAVRREEVGGLREALAGLPEQQRDAILLRELRGLSYEEVAANLSVTTSAVESLLFRARRTLQVRLREALATISPGDWVQPLRELATKVVGSGLAMPTAAKLVAVGMGTAVVAGGAADPTVIGLGHAPVPARHAAAPQRHAAAAGATFDAGTVWAGAARPPLRVTVYHGSTEGETSHHESVSRRDGSDGASSSTSSEQQSGGGTDGGTSAETSGTGSGSTSDGGGSAETAAAGGDRQATDSGGQSTGSGATSTDSASRELGD